MPFSPFTSAAMTISRELRDLKLRERRNRERQTESDRERKMNVDVIFLKQASLPLFTQQTSSKGTSPGQINIQNDRK